MNEKNEKKKTEKIKKSDYPDFGPGGVGEGLSPPMELAADELRTFELHPSTTGIGRGHGPRVRTTPPAYPSGSTFPIENQWILRKRGFDGAPLHKGKFCIFLTKAMVFE